MKTQARTRNSRHSSYDLYGDIERIKSALADAGGDVKGRAGEIIWESMNQAKKKSAVIEKNVSEYVADNTFKSLGITFLAGAFIGFLLRK